MNRLVLGCLAFAAVTFWTLAAVAEEPPWKQPGAEKAEKAGAEKVVPAEKPAGDAATEALKKDLGATLYDRLILPILNKMERAEKVLDMYSKEMEKPAEKRSKRADDLKLQAATFYLAANQEAKKAVSGVNKPDQKAAITTQFEKPALQKAIQIYLEHAEAALKAKDFKTALAFFTRVLQLDKENATAKEGILRVQQEMAAAAEAARKGQQGGGKDDGKKTTNRDDQDRIGREQVGKDYSKQGRGSEGYKQ